MFDIIGPAGPLMYPDQIFRDSSFGIRTSSLSGCIANLFGFAKSMHSMKSLMQNCYLNLSIMELEGNYYNEHLRGFKSDWINIAI